MLSLEDLTVWMWRENQKMHPHFCNKAVIRTFQIRKVDPGDEETGKIVGLAIIENSLEPITSAACSWREHKFCRNTPCSNERYIAL